MLYDTCGHAICLKCIEALRTLPPQFHSCSICKEPVNLAQVSPNVALQEALGHVGINGGHSNNSNNNNNHNDVSAEVGADVDTEGDAARPTNGARGPSPVDVDGSLPPQMPMCEVHGRELVLWCVDHGFLGCGACFREPPHEECDRYMVSLWLAKGGACEGGGLGCGLPVCVMLYAASGEACSAGVCVT
jgi:hypothetical protein